MLYPDLWSWVATYTDATQVAEYDADGREHAFREVDLPRVASVALVPTVEGLPLHVVHLQPDLGQRPIFFRRRQRLLDLATGEEGATATIHVLGWQQTVGSANVKSLTYFFEDGSSLQSSDDQAV